ncbi:MAG: metal ABC transporter permease [Planctomycetota bacterium]
MLNSFIEAWNLSTGLFIDGFLSLLIASIVLPAIGTLLVLRRMPFVAVAVPGIAGAGVAFSYFIWPSIFALAYETLDPPSTLFQNCCAFLFLTFGLQWLSSRGSRDRIESGAVLLFVITLALSEILLLDSIYDEFSHRWLHHGHVLSVLEEGRNRVLGTCLFIAMLAGFYRRELWLTAIDKEQASLSGLPEKRWLLIHLFLAGVASGMIVPELGPQVVLGLLLIPATISFPTARSLSGYAWTCSTIGLVSALFTFWISMNQNWPVAPSLIVTLAIFSLIHRVIKQRWWKI